jgi:hypothetical protein
MFETLSNDALSEMGKVGDRSLFKQGTRLDDLVGCLEQAISECRQAGISDAASASFGSQQVIGGLQAAQQILTMWWRAGELAS